jgi:hypothetical protein
MADPRPDDSARVALRDLLRIALSSAVGAGIFYLMLGGILDSASLQGVRYGGATQIAIALAAGIAAFAYGYHDLSEKARARALTARIDEELKKSAGDGGGDSVAAVSTSDVAAKVTGTAAAAQEVKEFVEQRKQRLLVDKKTLSAELAYLVDNWQPLPRDVKRAVNRFCVTYLVAYNRGLLKDPPVVSGLQLAKWLALSERWPQLGRALATSPEAIEDLEKYAGTNDDLFPGVVAGWAPLHASDRELRKFIADAPQLSEVLPRLVQYGMVQPAPGTGVAVQQTAPQPQTTDTGPNRPSRRARIAPDGV